MEGIGGKGMSPEYKITLDEKDYPVEVKMLDEGGVLVVTVGEHSYTMKPTTNDDGSLIVNDLATDYQVKLVKRIGANATLDINGKEVDVTWERLRKAETSAKTTTATSNGPKISGGIYPPMPGKITEVRVKVGDKVKSGKTVCILEAMKMFNELKAEVAGTVKEVNVEVGSMVSTSDLLVLIE